MNITEIANFVKQPQLIQRGDINELEKLCEKHPYAQTFQLLYLKMLSDSNSIHFENELTKRACSISNRAVLYDLVQSHEEIQLETTEFVVTSDQELLTSLNEDLRAAEPTTVTTAPEVDWSNIEATKEEKEVEDGNDSKIEISETSPLDLEILNSAAAAIIEHNTEQFISLSKTEEKETGTTSPEEPETSATKSFMGWIKSSNYAYSDEVTSSESSSKKLIEKFIQNEPKIEKGKTEFFSAPKTAKQSVSSEAMPVSATLAKIVALQGNFPKAIEIYQQLILKYPEKKTFFVAQISELEKNSR